MSVIVVRISSRPYDGETIEEILCSCNNDQQANDVIDSLLQADLRNDRCEYEIINVPSHKVLMKEINDRLSNDAGE